MSGREKRFLFFVHGPYFMMPLFSFVLFVYAQKSEILLDFISISDLPSVILSFLRKIYFYFTLFIFCTFISLAKPDMRGFSTQRNSATNSDGSFVSVVYFKTCLKHSWNESDGNDFKITRLYKSLFDQPYGSRKSLFD